MRPRRLQPGRHDPRRRPDRAGIVAAVLISGLALVAPVTGGAGPAGPGGAWTALGVVAALGQGLPLAWRSCRLGAASVIVLLSYAASGLLVGLTPPVGPWFAIWSLGTAPEPKSTTLAVQTWRSPAVDTWGTAALTGCLVAGAELAHPGAGASAALLMITALVATATWMVRADRGRVAAVREKGAAAERLRLARELHDVVGHGLGVVAIQSSTARLALQHGDTATATRAVALVEAASRAAMAEMRQMLGVLTESPGTAASTAAALPGIADISDLVQGVRETGIAVDWIGTGPWDAVRPAVQLCAFRVVQEGLTNVLKHAPGSHVVVEVAIRGDRLVTTVSSSGQDEPATGSTSGLGLAGLRARVDGLGGHMTAGPTQSGWTIQAEVPVSAGPR